MGYYINQQDGKFRMERANFEAAYQAALGLPEIEYRWVSSNWKKECSSLPEVLEEWRYTPEFDSEGNIVDLQFSGQKIGEEADLFAAIAPFVESGSFLEMYGEDGVQWRWQFKNQQFKEVYPEMCWPDE